MRLISKILVAALIPLMLASHVPAIFASATWNEVRSPHFVVVTDSTVGRARDVAHGFEQMRRVFVQRFGRDDVDAAVPLTIFAAADESTFRMLEPTLSKRTGGRLAGEFHRGWERQFAIIRLDTWGDSNETVVYHEYAHSVLHANIHWLPRWLDEGLAELYGYTRFERDRILLGAPSLRLQVTRERPLYPITRILTLQPNAAEYNNESDVQLVYAESWAIVHFMCFGPGMDSGRKLASFINLIQTDIPQLEAFKQTFGDTAAFDRALQEYIRGFSVKVAVLPADTRDDPKAYIARTLSPAEAAYQIGSFQVGAGEREEGRKSLNRALALDPHLAPIHEALGFLAFDEGSDEAARKEWGEALTLDPRLPRAQFALLMTSIPWRDHDRAGSLLLEPSILADLRGKLQEITQLAPWYAAPQAELALVEWRMRDLQHAYHDAILAEKLEPNRAGYHLLAARILLDGKQPAVAARYARYVASRWPAPDHNEALEVLQSVPAEQRGADPMPSLAMGDGTRTVRGTVASITCPAPGSKEHPKIAFQPDTPAGASVIEFAPSNGFAVGFSDTLWWGEDHFSFCHHTSGLPAMVAFKSGGELVALEFRDPMMPSLHATAEPNAKPGSATPAPSSADVSSSHP